MSEAGHRILSARANKLRHRPDRRLTRAHRADSFEDLHEANGAVLQHPTDRYSSDEEDEREAREERADQERMAKLKASLQPHVQSLSSTAHLSAAQLKVRYEARLHQAAQEVREVEGRMKRMESKLRQMNQWRMKVIRQKQFNPYDLIRLTASSLIEPTKLRHYDHLVARTVSRSFVRTFRVRRQVKHVHASVAGIVDGYVRGRADLLHQAEQEREHEERRAREAQQRDSQAQVESYQILAGTGRYAYQEFTPAHMAPKMSPLTGLPLDPPKYDQLAQPTLVGSLTDDTASSKPLSILTRAAALPPTDRLTLQSELAAWLAQAQKTIKAGYRQRTMPADADDQQQQQQQQTTTLLTTIGSLKPQLQPWESSPSTTATATAIPTSFSSSASLDPSSLSPTPLPSLMSSLVDAGPILRCIVEELLNAYGDSSSTRAAFRERTGQLREQEEKARLELEALDEDQKQLEAYLQLNLAGLANLIREQREVASLVAEHRAYDQRLRRTYRTIRLHRDRHQMESRKAARQSGPHAATGGVGVSSTLLAHARKQRAEEEEASRIALLQEIMKQQELSMQSVARSQAEMNAQAIRELNPEFFAVGATGSSGGAGAGAGADGKGGAPPTAAATAAPPGLEELMSLLEDDASNRTPYLAAFVERKRREIEKGLRARGFKNVGGDNAIQGITGNGTGATSTTTTTTATTTSATAHGAETSGTSPRKNLEAQQQHQQQQPPPPSQQQVQLRPSSAAPASSHPTTSHPRPASAGGFTFTPRSGHGGGPPTGLPVRGVGILPTTHRLPPRPPPAPEAKTIDSTPMGFVKRYGAERDAAAAATANAQGGHLASSLADRLTFHNGSADHHQATYAIAVDAVSSVARNPFLDGLPLVAYPSPPTVKPIQIPVLHLAASAHPAHLYVPTQLIGGLTIQAREKEMYRLKNSPYMTSTIMTPQEEMAAIEGMARKKGTGGPPHASSSASSASPSASSSSARGSKPLKANPLARHHRGQLDIGGGSSQITRQKLAQQKLRIEKSIYEHQLFEGQNY